MSDARYTEAEVAKRWKIGTRTLQQWRRTSKGPAHIVIGSHTVLYREEDLRAYESRSVTGGEIPEQARASMKRAANFLDLISRWSISDKSADQIKDMRDELRTHLAIAIERTAA